jgi:predicted NACHT family NTPase
VQATPAIPQLASTPLLATTLVLIWRNEGDLPEQRVDLYEPCCRDLIEQWERHHDALNRCLHERDIYVCQAAPVSIQQLLDGRPIPGYRWVPVQKRRAM